MVWYEEGHVARKIPGLLIPEHPVKKQIYKRDVEEWLIKWRW